MRPTLKKRLPFLALALCMLFATSCGQANKAPADAQAWTDEDFAARYREAAYAYGWFHIYNMEYNAEDKHEQDGVTYYRVTQQGLGNMNALREYLGSLFAPGIVEKLLGSMGQPPKFRDIDGALYTSLKVRPSDRYAGEERTRVVRSQGDATLVNLLVDVERFDKNMKPEDALQYTFVLRYTDGRWLFEDFTAVR